MKRHQRTVIGVAKPTDWKAGSIATKLLPVTMLLVFVVLALMTAAGALGISQTAGGVSSRPELSIPRYAHTATLLSNGQLVVVGGIGRDGSTLTSVVAYDASLDTWTSRAELNKARSNHTATLLSDGRLLVTGGYTGTVTTDGVQELSSTEIYDPSTNRWTIAAPMHAPRAIHTATLLGDGRVLVVGLSFEVKTDVAAEVYDPTMNTWLPTGPMATPRLGGSATRLSDGRVLVEGGSDPTTPGYLRTGEIYDPSTNAWSSGGSMTFPRTAQTSTVLRDGRVLVVGGATASKRAEIFDPATLRWKAVPVLTVGRLLATATLLPSGRVAIIGGLADDGHPTPTSEIYDPITDSWSGGPTLATGRMSHTANTIEGGGILIVGGSTGGESAQATAETEYEQAS